MWVGEPLFTLGGATKLLRRTSIFSIENRHGFARTDDSEIHSRKIKIKISECAALESQKMISERRFRPPIHNLRLFLPPKRIPYKKNTKGNEAWKFLRTPMKIVSLPALTEKVCLKVAQGEPCEQVGLSVPVVDT